MNETEYVTEYTKKLTETVRVWVEALREAGIKITISINVEVEP